MNKGVHQKKRVRKKDKRDFHAFIGKLYSMPIRDLKNIAPERKYSNGYTREQIIQTIISEKYEKNIPIFSIRKIGSDYKKNKDKPYNHPH